MTGKLLIMFSTAILSVLKHEGGYVNHPSDPGGETNWGITKRSYPDLDIKNLTKEQAVEIYKRDFWNKYKIENYPVSVRLQMFDMSVNMGNRNAVKTLQRTLNRINANLEITGVLDERTREALDNAPFLFNSALTVERIKYYVDLAQAKKSLKVFLSGWVRRAIEINYGN